MKKRRLTKLFMTIVVTIAFFSAFLAIRENLRIDTLPAEEIESPSQSIGTTEKKTKKVQLVAVGDNLIHEALYKNAQKADGSYSFDAYYQHIAPKVKAADVAIINQETLLGGKELGFSGFPQFNSPQEVGDAVVNAGFNIVLQANNHSMDRRETGAVNTMSYWKTKHPDVTTVGMNTSAEEQETIRVVEKNGIRIAVLNYTYGLNGLPLPDGKPYMVNLLDEELMTRHIRKAKKLADVVMVFPHWGEEYVYEPSLNQKEWTELFAKEGVDIVIGTHPHVLQPVEWIDREDGGKMLVYYSLGNLISRQQEVPRMLGGMATLTIEKKEDDSISITDAGLIPLVTQFEGSGKNFRVYPLPEYTQELAEKHGLRAKGFSYKKMQTLAKDIVPEPFLIQ